MNFGSGSAGVLGHDISNTHAHGIAATGGKETRPVNLAVDFIIKY